MKTWAHKIETAKQAREGGKQARIGKAPVFTWQPKEKA